MANNASRRSGTGARETQPVPKDSGGPIGWLTRKGLPVTKANYVRALFATDESFDLPMDAEREASIPPGIPGPMPTSYSDLYP